MTNSQLPNFDIEERVEELAWDCRTSETPKELEDTHMANRFGTTCQEYWCPDHLTRTIKLEYYFPDWIDKDKMVSRLSEVWQWAEVQGGLMRTIILDMIKDLRHLDVPVQHVEITNKWFEWWGRPPILFGVKCITTKSDHILRAFSLPKYGRYTQVDLRDLCDHDLTVRKVPGKSIERCFKCGYHAVHKEDV